MSALSSTSLPGFAHFLLHNHLQQLCEKQVSYFLAAEIPLLKYLPQLSRQDLVNITLERMTGYLGDLSLSKTDELIEKFVRSWHNDDFERIGKFQFLSEDIVLINHVRGKSLKDFIPLFTTDANKILQLVCEIDDFVAKGSISMLNAYEQILREHSSRQERNLLDAQRIAHIGSFERDFIQNDMDLSPEFIDIFGIQNGTEYDEFRSYIHPDDRSMVDDALTYAMQHGPYECEYRYVKDTLKYIWSRGVISFEHSRPVKFIGTVQDITERKTTEQLLVLNATALQRSNESLQQFAYVASHDLKEPLRKISLLTDRILEQEKSMAPVSENRLQKVHLSAGRMLRMIDDIMAYSTMQQWEEKKPTDLNAIFSDCLELLEFTIEEKGAVIQSDVLPEAKVVSAQFRQLFQNLLSNALKFSRRDVAPVITVTHSWLTTNDVLQFNLLPADRYLMLKISDNGVGFSMDYSQKLFVLFSRLHDRSEFEGTGIGLAIAKRIVDNHQGVIYAAGEEGAGAIFSFIIPQ